MFKFISAVGFCLLTLGVCLLQLWWATTLPFPLNQLNSVWLFIIWLALFHDQTTSVWAVVPSALWLELFSVAPFGVTSTALFISVLCLHWWLKHVLTNYSPVTIGLAGFLVIATYRFLLTLGLLLGRAIAPNQVPAVDLSALFTGYGFEIIITTGALVLAYALGQRSSKRLSPYYIEGSAQ